MAEEQLTRLRRRMNRLTKRLATTEAIAQRAAKEAVRATKDARFHALEMQKVAPAVAALEARVEDLRQQLEPTPVVSDDQELVEARGLVEAIRREHEQIRVRLSALSRYEERLRRLEEKNELPHV